MKRTDEEIREAVAKNQSLTGVLRQFGITVAGGNFTTLKHQILKLGIDTSHFTGQAHLKGKTHGWSKKNSWEEILKKGTLLTSEQKKRLVKENLLKYECSVCSIKEWNGSHLVLQVDHIDGDVFNNLLINLRMLCPNCHSQTSTFRGRNIKFLRGFVSAERKKENEKISREKKISFCVDCKSEIQKDSKRCESCHHKSLQRVERPSKEQLHELVWLMPTTKVAERFQVSDKTIEKWCKSLGVEKPPRGYWAKQK